MTLRLTQQQFDDLRRRRTAPAGVKPRQAVTFALKPDYARELAIQIKDAGFPVPVLEYAFDAQLDGSGRVWRMDLAWPDLRFAVECDGAVHRIKGRFKSDLAKHQAADRLGYRVLRVSPAQVRDRTAVLLVADMLARRA